MKFLRLYMSLLVMAVVSFGGAAMAEVSQFFNTVQDLPLMQGLSEIEEEGLQFDKPEGRVTEAVALIDSVGAASVLAYYNASLPQFGWARIAENTFVRHDEKLTLNVEANEGHEFLKVRIIPQ